MNALCQMTGLSRASYYRWLAPRAVPVEMELRDALQQIAVEFPAYGYRRLTAELQRRNKFFVDSRTSAQTVAAAEAQKIGLAHVSRDVFLDDERTEAAIATQLQTAIKLAHKQGSAVMIGHPYPQTLAVLERELPKLKAQGVDWIDIKLMISVRSNQAMAGHGKNGVYRYK